MSVSAVSAPTPVAPPATSAPTPKPADVQNGGAADGTRTPQPTVLAALPPGQGTRIDQLA